MLITYFFGGYSCQEMCSECCENADPNRDKIQIDKGKLIATQKSLDEKNNVLTSRDANAEKSDAGKIAPLPAVEARAQDPGSLNAEQPEKTEPCKEEKKLTNGLYRQPLGREMTSTSQPEWEPEEELSTNSLSRERKEPSEKEAEVAAASQEARNRRTLVLEETSPSLAVVRKMPTPEEVESHKDKVKRLIQPATPAAPEPHTSAVTSANKSSKADGYDKKQVEQYLDKNGFEHIKFMRKRMNYTYYPLHLAVQENNTEMVRLLLAAGASASAKNSAGQTARALATECDRKGSHAEVLKVLPRESFGASRKSMRTPSPAVRKSIQPVAPARST